MDAPRLGRGDRWFESSHPDYDSGQSANSNTPVITPLRRNQVPTRCLGTVLLVAIWVASILLLTGPAPASSHDYLPARGGVAAPSNTTQRPRHGTIAARAHAIREVFGPVHGGEAIRVAWCESRLKPWARNGQYLGVFQMGAAERHRFGHGPDVWTQARAAHRYFLLAGWKPWECKP